MSKSKYEKGERITSLDELRKQKVAFFDFGIKNNGFFGSMQFRTICNCLDRGIYKAKLKEVEENKSNKRIAIVGGGRNSINYFSEQIKMYEELQQYRSIGTVEEFRKWKDNQEINKELKSHDEKHILKYCIGLMKEMVDEFAEWYRWKHGENAIEELDEEEKFCVRKTYFRIVKELFLFNTRHSGGNSTRAKCEQLGVDSSEEIEFGWGEEE